ncbi:hypothetical protein QRD43_20515 [Pelomonas sp. APW6]|uniref:Uncharacterized protein n=1 Tax=Roseateles subflavus TaxID=3053353 RepID=A0ABT7LN46_9BURK|nr:DUF6750 family protein [Pelomonas sp. APW6]MDL5034297.1 hypothetical protein [Pelomonas sp. APW6]
MNFKTFAGRARETISKAKCILAVKREALGAFILMMSARAHAGGLLDLITNFTALFNAAKVAVVALFGVVGLVAIGYGGKKMWDKGGERGDDVKMTQIIYPILGGTICLAITYFGVLTLITAGGSAADMGRTQ